MTNIVLDSRAGLIYYLGMEDMEMFEIDTASQALQQIMLAESAEEWEPYGHKAARIVLPDGNKLVVSEQRIAEAAREIELGDIHPELEE